MRLRFLLATVLFPISAALAGPGTGPSFDCTKSTSEAEKAICASDKLSRHDRILADYFHKIIGKAPENAKKFLLTDQRGWIHHVNNVCQSKYGHEYQYYVQDCVRRNIKEQIEFYEKNPIAFISPDNGYLMIRQSFNSVPVLSDDVIENYPAVRTEKYQYHTFLSPKLSKLSAPTPKMGDDMAYETFIDSKYTIIRKDLVYFQYLEIVHYGGTPVSEKKSIVLDLKNRKNLKFDDIFTQKECNDCVIADAVYNNAKKRIEGDGVPSLYGMQKIIYHLIQKILNQCFLTEMEFILIETENFQNILAMQYIVR